MKSIFTTFLMGLFYLILSVAPLHAQITSANFKNLDSTSIIKITLAGGSAYEGKFVRQTTVRVVINVAGSGDMSFLFSDIKSMEVSGKISRQPDRVEIPSTDSTQMVLISLKDGSIFAGTIISKSDTEIILSNATAGKVTIAMSQIKSIAKKEVESFGKPSKWLPNPNPSRYFFAPSAFNLKKGEGYYQNVYVDISMFGYGITDWFSIGGGFEFFASVAALTQGIFMPIWVITPKIGFPVGKNWHLGAGFMGGAINGLGLTESNFIGWGITYGVVTYGNVDNNLTFGAGFPMTTGKLNNGKHLGSPIIVLDGMYRVSQKVSLISENWILTGKGFTGTKELGSFFGYGIRLWGETMSFDIGFINNKGIAKVLFIGLPYVDFVYRFTRRKKPMN